MRQKNCIMRHAQRIMLLACVLMLWPRVMMAQFSFPISEAEEAGFPQPRAYRAVWFTTIGGLDWPSSAATSAASREKQQADLRAQFDRLQAAGINTILFQTRIRGTVAYRSRIEPFDYVFAGRSCKDPGYDPLAFAVEEAHQRGMEIHAWVVAFPVCRLSDMKSLGSAALPYRHPELCYKSTENYVMDPGQPGTATYLAALCREIAEGYDVDGIHLDYIRYPEHTVRFDDAATYRRYGQGRPKAEWRRENVSRVVETIAREVRAVRPDIRLSCSPIGKYADVATASSKGWNAYHAVYQDPQEWIEKGWMDMLFPMMYFDGNNFYPFLFDWKERVGQKQVAAGLGLYQLDRREGNRTLFSLVRQLKILGRENMGGFALFRAKFLLNNVKGFYDYCVGQYGRIALLPPPMASHPLAEPLPQPDATASLNDWDLQLSWKPCTDAEGTPLAANIYRVEPEGAMLQAHHIKASSYTLRPALPANLHKRYAITFIDRYGHESEPVFVN